MSSLQDTVKVLKEGGVALIPTDTVYGLAVRPDVEGAEEKIYQIKGRDRDKPLPLLVADFNGVVNFGARVGDIEVRLAERFWPGPLTLILSVDSVKEGFRVPDHSVALEVIRMSGGVLRVTSANLSGKKPALTAGEAMESLTGVDAVIDAGRVPGGQASTVAEVIGDGCMFEVKVLREGPVSKAELDAVVNEK